ncbi:MAG TPA: FlgD immunoglobulin-like domain containing protein [Gaiellaceae bacterium]
MSPESRRAQIAAGIVVAALLGGSAAAFAYTEHVKLERSPVFATRVGKHLGPNCRCQYRKIPIQFTLRKPDRLTVVVVDSDGNVVRTLLSRTAVRAGRQRFGWDGRNDAGQVVPEGTYKPRLHLAREHRTIVMPNPIKVDTTAPTISLVALVPRVFSPGKGFRKNRVVVHWRASEPVQALLYANGKLRVHRRPFVDKGFFHWLGTGLPAGQYHLVLRAVDRTGNVSAGVPLGVVHIRFVEVRPHVVLAKAGTKVGFRVIADARRIHWRFGNRRGTTGAGILLLRVAKPGRYRLVVSVDGHSAQALAIVSPRG